MYAYKNSSGEIIGLSVIERSLSEAQAINPDIASVDANPSQEEVDTFEAIGTLENNRGNKFISIDSRTDQLITDGFTHDSHQFSLSTFSQMKMVGAHAARDDVAMVYPIIWNTIHDDDTYSISSSTDLNDFYISAMSTIRTLLDSGTTLKNATRAATTQAELDAVVDNR